VDDMVYGNFATKLDFNNSNIKNINVFDRSAKKQSENENKTIHRDHLFNNNHKNNTQNNTNIRKSLNKNNSEAFKNDLLFQFDLQKDYSKSDNNHGNSDFNDELPLLEELGISPEHIKMKIKCVMMFGKVDKNILDDGDMGGPFLFLILFGASLLLRGKVQFGYLYGFGIFGCVMIFMLINLMSKNGSILLYNTISVMGYCLIPIVILSYINVFLPLNSLIGSIFCVVSILFSTYSATIFFEEVLNMKEQKWLIFYPLTLFYICFVFLAIF